MHNVSNIANNVKFVGDCGAGEDSCESLVQWDQTSQF